MANDPTVNQLRCLKYCPDGTIYFKLSFDQDEYQILPQRPSKKHVCLLPKSMYKQRLTISKKKWDHLQSLKPYIPLDTHSYYNEIPFQT